MLDTFCKHLMVQIGGKDPFDASQGGLKKIIQSANAKRQSPDDQREWHLGPEWKITLDDELPTDFSSLLNAPDEQVIQTNVDELIQDIDPALVYLPSTSRSAKHTPYTGSLPRKSAEDENQRHHTTRAIPDVCFTVPGTLSLKSRSSQQFKLPFYKVNSKTYTGIAQALERILSLTLRLGIVDRMVSFVGQYKQSWVVSTTLYKVVKGAE